MTGSSGFVGSRLLVELEQKWSEPIYCLVRKDRKMVGSKDGARTEFVSANIQDSHLYAPYLEKCDTVIHLAAVTGKASPEEFFEVNAAATIQLVKLCQKFGVKKFVFVSTIAVKFKDKRRYFYAQSKEEAENYIRSSGVPFAIVRPTIIIGPKGKAWDGLKTFAKAPWLCIPGNGQVSIQPVFVNDLVNMLVALLKEPSFSDKTFEVGGPEKISMDAFLQKVWGVVHGRPPGTIIHIPIQPVLGVLSLLERFCLRLLPVTVGQLATFRNDGVADESTHSWDYRRNMVTLDQMINISSQASNSP